MYYYVTMNSNKFENDDSIYFNYIKEIESFNLPIKNLIYDFPAYVGAVNIARMLTFYEIYKQTIDLSGDIADVGTYNGASMLTFAKLIKIFEPYSNTNVHGFDHFSGQEPGPNDDPTQAQKYVGSKHILESLISLQGLSGYTFLHDLNLITDLSDFCKKYPWLRFKLIFLDCGIENVMKETLEHFWPRLVPGGILILDHFNNGSSPTESRIVESLTSISEIKQIPFSRSPTAYVKKQA